MRWEDVFRGYDIRGLYPSAIDPEIARRLGAALARSLRGPFLIGRDTRRESKGFARDVVRGLRSGGARVELLGITPTPEVAFLARHRSAVGIAVTPSHNALGYVGLKGFTPSGRLFDREWGAVAKAFRSAPERSRSATPTIGPPRRATRARISPALRAGNEAYLGHITAGLRADLTVALDTRGGATARVAPDALRRIGARVTETTKGFSPRFFGTSPEPRPETLASLRRRIKTARADVGFAFDGDGDRCVVLDDRGHPVEPEVVALLLHQTFADRGSALVASADASRVLERFTRTVRSRVGGRFVTRAMRRSRAQVGVEPSGHYYVRRYGADSDGVLTACLVSHALRCQDSPLSRYARRFGRFYRGAFTVDYPSMTLARVALRRIVRALGARARRGLDGFTFQVAEGWCLLRRSNTQPSLRFAFEATGPAALDRIRRSAEELVRRSQPTTR